MKFILFQLITGFTLGSIVGTTYDKEVNKFFKIVEIIYKPSFKRPFYFQVILLNSYGGFDYCGTKCLKDIYDMKLNIGQIESAYRIFNLNYSFK